MFLPLKSGCKNDLSLTYNWHSLWHCGPVSYSGPGQTSAWIKLLGVKGNCLLVSFLEWKSDISSSYSLTAGASPSTDVFFCAMFLHSPTLLHFGSFILHAPGTAKLALSTNSSPQNRASVDRQVIKPEYITNDILEGFKAV